jgi:hypothetical protein
MKWPVQSVHRLCNSCYLSTLSLRRGPTISESLFLRTLVQILKIPHHLDRIGTYQLFKLNNFRRFRKEPIKFALSVRPSAYNNSRTAERIFVNFGISVMPWDTSNILNLGTRWRMVSFTPRPLYPRKRAFSTNWTGGWVDLRVCLDAVPNYLVRHQKPRREAAQFANPVFLPAIQLVRLHRIIPQNPNILRFLEPTISNMAASKQTVPRTAVHTQIRLRNMSKDPQLCRQIRVSFTLWSPLPTVRKTTIPMNRMRDTAFRLSLHWQSNQGRWEGRTCSSRGGHEKCPT